MKVIKNFIEIESEVFMSQLKINSCRILKVDFRSKTNRFIIIFLFAKYRYRIVGRW